MQAIVTAAACVALTNYVNRGPAVIAPLPVAAPPQIIYLVPGQAPAPAPK